MHLGRVSGMGYMQRNSNGKTPVKALRNCVKELFILSPSEICTTSLRQLFSLVPPTPGLDLGLLLALDMGDALANALMQAHSANKRTEAARPQGIEQAACCVI